MNIKKLRVVLIGLLVIILLLFVISRLLTPKSANDLRNNEGQVVHRTVDMDTIAKSQDIDYNHLTSQQIEYFKQVYGDTAAFTENGIEVYMEKAFSGKPQKTITSNWPENEISKSIVKPEFGKVDRIEYSDNKIEIFINEAKAGNLSNYMKELKKNNYKEKEKKQDGNVFTQYLYENDDGITVRGRYYKKDRRIEIKVENKI